MNQNMKLILKKRVLPTIFITIISCFLLIGCSDHTKKEKKEISSIEIIQTSDNKVWTLTDKDIITKFMNALNNRKGTKARIDIRPHDYSVKILYTDNSSEAYSLWIDKDVNIYGVLMNENKTWFIEKESNGIFKEILK